MEVTNQNNNANNVSSSYTVAQYTHLVMSKVASHKEIFLTEPYAVHIFTFLIFKAIIAGINTSSKGM